MQNKRNLMSLGGRRGLVERGSVKGPGKQVEQRCYRDSIEIELPVHSAAETASTLGASRLDSATGRGGVQLTTGADIGKAGNTAVCCQCASPHESTKALNPTDVSGLHRPTLHIRRVRLCRYCRIQRKTRCMTGIDLVAGTQILRPLVSADLARSHAISGNKMEAAMARTITSMASTYGRCRSDTRSFGCARRPGTTGKSGPCGIAHAAQHRRWRTGPLSFRCRSVRSATEDHHHRGHRRNGGRAQGRRRGWISSRDAAIASPTDHVRRRSAGQEA